MKKIFSFLAMGFLLSGCVESMALLGPASSVAGSGNVAQSAFSSALSYGVKKQTGKSPSEHALAYVKKHNPDNKKSKCISFLEASDSEICEIVKKNILTTKKKILESSKIENLAKKSDIIKR